MEDIIRERTNSFIQRFREQCAQQGVMFTEQHEECIRIGIGYGISLAGLALSHLSADAVISEDAERSNPQTSKYTS